MSTRQTTDDMRIESIRIGPDDPRYLAVIDRRFNKRFSASPDYVRLVGSTDQVVSAVEEAVREGRRLVVTSGGHCLEGFVSDPEVRVIIDVSPMKRVYYDAKRGAVAVEAGATVGETFRALLETWGVVIPLGEYPEIGMGGHPDVDLADPALNTSGVPWPTLYYKANYPRLQRIKARWDPRDVFRHALSIRVG
jgi:FAD/FMN-containing dehydrogenase